MSAYPPLPTIEPRRQDEPIAHYGMRIFRYLLAEGWIGTVTLTDEDLELAAYAGVTASAGQYTLESTHELISDLRHVIAQALARRLARAAEGVPAAPGGATIADRPNSGPMAPLTPAPEVRPPGGGAVTPPAVTPAAPRVRPVPAPLAF